jgi:Pectate lyase superfamily protein
MGKSIKLIFSMKRIFFISLFLSSLVAKGQFINQNPRNFNVVNYGAKGDGVTDDTQAFIKAAKAAGTTLHGGVVYVPFPSNFYLIAGPIDSTSYGYDCNCQIPIPVDSLDGNRSRITFRGEFAPNFSIVSPTGTVYTGVKGVILKSTYAGTRSKTVKGTAVFGTNGPNIGGVGNGENLNYMTVENINIIVKNNPNGNGPEIGGVCYRHGAAVELRNDTYSVDTAGSYTTVPIENISGFETSDCDNEINNVINNVQSSCVRYGFIIGEHTAGDQLSAFMCFYGIGAKWGNHAASFNRVLVQWSTNGITYVDQGSSCNITPLSILNISEFDFEPSGTCYSSKWYNTVYAVNDSLNRITGNVRYWATVCGTGGNGLSSWNANGGTQFIQTPIGGGVTGVVGGDQAIQYDSLGSSSGNKNMFSLNYSTGALGLTKNANAGLSFSMTNTTAGTLAYERILFNGDTYGTFIGNLNASYTTYGALVPSSGAFYTAAPTGEFFVDNATAPKFIIALGSGNAGVYSFNGSSFNPLTTNSVSSGTAALRWSSDNTVNFNSSGGMTLHYVAKTTTYGIAATDYMIDCTSGTFTVTLPTAVSVAGQVYVIKNSGTGVITIATTSSQTIDGVTTQTLGTQYQSITVMSNGANWIIE